MRPAPEEIEMTYDGYYVKNIPRGVPPIYGSNGVWCGLYVDKPEPGRYQVRDYAVGTRESSVLDLPGLRAWLASHGYTCPDLT